LRQEYSLDIKSYKPYAEDLNCPRAVLLTGYNYPRVVLLTGYFKLSANEKI
jgi:hypothetical protein